MAALVSSSRPVYMRLEAKRTQRGKRLGREEANVSVRIPKSGSKQGRLLQECKAWFVCGGRGVSYSMLWRVVFTLSAFAIAFPPSAPSLLKLRLQAKRKQREKEVGKEEANVSVRIPKERIKGRSSASGMQGVGCLWRKRCFLLDVLERRVHFEHLSDCLSGFGIEVVVWETTSKEEAEVKEVGKERSNSQRAHSKRADQARSSASLVD